MKVPDVANQTVIDAEKTLKDAGFEVAVETEKEVSDQVEKGKVIKTSPVAGRSIKKGTTITIYESLGEEVYEIENFVGKKVESTKQILEELHKLKVKIEKKDVEDVSKYDADEIIEQSKAEGTKLAEGDEVILYIPNVMETYPDFVEEGWSIEEVQNFCNQYGIILKINYEETLQYTEGMVISQSRTSTDPIIKNARLTVTVAKAPQQTATPSPTPTSPITDLLP